MLERMEMEPRQFCRVVLEAVSESRAITYQKSIVFVTNYNTINTTTKNKKEKKENRKKIKSQRRQTPTTIRIDIPQTHSLPSSHATLDALMLVQL